MTSIYYNPVYLALLYFVTPDILMFSLKYTPFPNTLVTEIESMGIKTFKHSGQHTETFRGVFALHREIYNISMCPSGRIQNVDESSLSTPTTGFH